MLSDVIQLPFIVNEWESTLDSIFAIMPRDAVRLPPDFVLAIVVCSYALGMNGTDESGQGRDNFFHVLNKALREWLPGKMHQLKPYLYFLLSGSKQLPLFTGMVYRGIPADELKVIQITYLLGIVVHWSGFTSTSAVLSENVRGFAGGRGEIIFRIPVLSKQSN